MPGRIGPYRSGPGRKRGWRLRSERRISGPEQFTVTAANKVWGSDITYVPADEGWLYVAGHKDLYAGDIVGYAMGERLTRNLISQSLLRAVATKRPAQGLIHHSDRGSQYCSHEYRTILERFGIQASMSRKGNWYDNA